MKKGINLKKMTKRQWILIGILLVATIGIVTTLLLLSKKENSVSEASAKQYIKRQENQLELEQIIEENASKKITEEITEEEIDLEYTTIYQNNPELPKGMIQVLTQGRDGQQTIVNKKVYEGDILIKEEQSGNIVTKAAITKVVEVGTGNYNSNYKVKKGDTLYVTSYTLNMMQEPNIESEKITTLQKGKEVTLLEIKDGWYKVKTVLNTGWVDKQCLTYLTPENKEKYETATSEEKSKNALLATLSKNMRLNKPSGLSLNQFKKVLSNNEKDKNKIFEQNAQYFYYIEKQYNINGLFVAAVGIHESNWGSSKISLSKKNLFGYGANDRDPYNNAYEFATYAEGIDLLARVFVKYYLNPAGTKIYDNQVASGKYYISPTLDSVNKRYASDKKWANSVYTHMQNLYNRL